MLYEKFKNEAWLCRVWSSFHGSVATWTIPVGLTIDPLQHAYSVGLRTGDIEYAMLNACLICWNNFEIQPLPVLDTQLKKYSAAMKSSGHTLALVMLKPLLAYVVGTSEHEVF